MSDQLSDVCWRARVQRLVHRQTKLVGDALLKAQPVQLITEQWGHVIAASASVNELGRGIQNTLQSVHLLLRNSSE